jgi:hypothetical protein
MRQKLKGQQIRLREPPIAEVKPNFRRVYLQTVYRNGGGQFVGMCQHRAQRNTVGMTAQRCPYQPLCFNLADNPKVAMLGIGVVRRFHL